MACYHPIPAYQETRGGPVKLGPPLGTANLALPCQKCVGCRTDRATMWARRCTHEAQQWDSNIFLTLTYADDHLPEEAHLEPHELQKFFKRLRKNAHGDRSIPHGDKRISPIRYFACGEYGEENGRPHYHAAIFNLRPKQKRCVGKDLYEDEEITSIWGKGNAYYAPFTPATAAYIAQYQLKKQRGDNVDQDGVWKPPPFLRVSQGIGRAWLDKYATDLQHGYLVTDGTKGPIPRYYKRRLKTHQPSIAETIEKMSEKHRTEIQSNRNDPERLTAQEIIHEQQKTRKEKRDLKSR